MQFPRAEIGSDGTQFSGELLIASPRMLNLVYLLYARVSIYLLVCLSLRRITWTIHGDELHEVSGPADWTLDETLSIGL